MTAETKDMMLANEEVLSLMHKIDDACHGNRCAYAIAALWFTLLKTLMHSEECTFPEAIKHAQKLVELTTPGT